MKTAFYNAKVYTGAGFAQAFTVEDGRFTAVGGSADMLSRLADGDARCDLGGRFVCAGFNDSHMHLLGYGKALSNADLAPHTHSLSALLSAVRDYMDRRPPRAGQWLLGRGWNQDYFTDVRRMPNRRDLDAISTEVPVMLTRACGHCCALNSRALALAGINSTTTSPEGGAIGREPDGEPDGLLYDNAIDIVNKVLPAPDKREIMDMMRLACRSLNSYGITSVQTDDYSSVRGVPFETINDAYRELRKRGELTVRVYEQANFSELDHLRRFVEAGNVTGIGDCEFRIGPLKLLGDGSLGGRTAYLSRPYADAPDTRGFSLLSKAQLGALISYANAHGMQIAVHAIGDACLDAVLDAIEAALSEHPRADHRHGIVHCQITRADQLERIAALKLHVYAQSIFLDYDNHIVRARAGDELAATSYSWKTLMERGVSVSNGSDCPVERPDALEGIECAVTRTSLDGTGPYLPDQAFTVSEALDSFTIRGAEASFEEAAKGRIAPGYLADFTVLADDPFAAEPRKLHSIPVAATYLAGKCVYSNAER